MTKKPFNQLLILISILIFTSCLFFNGSDNSDTDIKEVLGSWRITKKSLKKMKNDDQKTDHKIITSFKLNSDSTATVFFGVFEKKIMNGTWIWQAEKKLGNENFGLSIKSDVVIRVNGLYTLGLQLREDNNLFTRDYTFEKQK
ncbi:hypothetical protein [Sunxiuqinia indica]|uniref:hypothetical protein n=1 Tax=Sunxiuqinia indica TaxID=2692584 RepID=UPI0013572202|nr:hypothetical protein [Sunxiuqinia indica]